MATRSSSSPRPSSSAPRWTALTARSSKMQLRVHGQGDKSATTTFCVNLKDLEKLPAPRGIGRLPRRWRGKLAAARRCQRPRAPGTVFLLMQGPHSASCWCACCCPNHFSSAAIGKPSTATSARRVQCSTSYLAHLAGSIAATCPNRTQAMPYTNVALVRLPCHFVFLAIQPTPRTPPI